MESLILYRQPEMSDEELATANKYFQTTKSRIISNVNKAQVIARYSTWPYYDELYYDLSRQCLFLPNTPEQHNFIADVGEWYTVLKDHTARTWTELTLLPDDTSFVLKGKWKSRKDKWSTLMFAKDKKAAIDVYCRLQDDTLIGSDTIYIREYIPLKTFLIGINGLPITEEYRFFVYDKHIFCGGFYWQNYWDDMTVDDQRRTDFFKVDMWWFQEIIDLIGDCANFYSVDVARTESGKWIVVEINDGQQSGLSMIEPDDFYRRLNYLTQYTIY